MTHFLAAPLDETNIDQAFPLIRSLRSSVPLARWRDYALTLVSGSADRGGALGVRNAGGYLHGRCTYNVSEDLTSFRVLTAQNVVALDLLGGWEAAHALRDGLAATARSYLMLTGPSTVRLCIACSSSTAARSTPSGPARHSTRPTSSVRLRSRAVTDCIAIMRK